MNVSVARAPEPKQIGRLALDSCLIAIIGNNFVDLSNIRERLLGNYKFVYCV